MENEKHLTPGQSEGLLQTLKTRFEANTGRHKGILWEALQKKLENQPQKLWALNEMEATGGEPDVIAYNKETDAYIFCDCSAESPAGRRNLCYDPEALLTRKKNKPQNSALNMANFMGTELLTEEQYRTLQTLGEFDTKTSSWLLTPDKIRKLGGALFGDRRYNHVFVYHNGAESYYGARGFRVCLKV